MVQRVAISEIKVEQRPRQELGDLESLAASIAELGLLQPIGVTSEKLLVWGERRLKACEGLGWTEIDAVVDPTLDDILKAAKAERDENICRKPFTHTEAVAKARQIEHLERERARRRQAEAGPPTGRGAKRTACGNLPQAVKGKTRDKVAAAVGMSGRTYEKAKKVVETGTPELIQAMDEGTASVDAAVEIASLPPGQQRKVVTRGKQAITAAAARIKRQRQQQREAQKLKDSPCDVVAARWIKSIHDALVPVNSVRRDMGGGREWARTWDRENLIKMANELRFVIGQYQQWLAEIEEVLNETAE